MPTPEEVAALLALPVEVRAALAKCEGPGWMLFTREGHDSVRDYGSPGLARRHARDYDHGPNDWAWLPASEAAVLDVARAFVPGACDFFVESTRGDWFQAGVGYPSDGGKAWKRGIGDTARLAALRLLAGVKRPG